MACAACATCAICCEVFNKVTRTKVVCTHCNAETCKACVSRYLLSTTQDAHCMSCNARWTRDFMFYNLNSTFINITYAKHRGGVLYEMEKALLPETMPIAIITKQIQDTIVELNSVRAECNALYKAYYPLASKNKRSSAETHKMEDIRQKRTIAQNEKIKLMLTQARLEREIRDYDQNMENNPASTSSRSKPVQKYIRPCSVADCRGFISKNMVCSLCQSEYCEQCHEVLTSDHRCKHEDIESAKAIMKDSKNCPNCHVITHRISGCPQMWCTLCHTVWNWNTGAIETGIVHNPHYFDYMRRTGSVPIANAGGQGGNPCFEGGLGGQHHQIGNTIQRLQFANHPDFIYQIHRLRNHIMVIERPRYATNQLRDNRDLRVRYLLNDIDDKRFKQLLQQREKRIAKKREFEQVIEMVCNVLEDLMGKFNRSSSQDEAMSVEAEFHNICDYANESLVNIGKIFKCKHPHIDQSFTFVS